MKMLSLKVLYSNYLNNWQYLMHILVHSNILNTIAVSNQGYKIHIISNKSAKSKIVKYFSPIL